MRAVTRIIFSTQITPDSYKPDEFCKRLLDATVKFAAPDTPVIAAIYAAYSDKKNKGYWRKQYDGTILHTPNSSLDYLYDFLCDFGYELSDAELALKDGSHPLLLTEDKTAPQEADAATETGGAS